MLKCPNCAERIPSKISQEGGTCPRCAHLILPFGEDFEFEASDTQERVPTSGGFDDSDLDMITYDETEEYEVTELISRAENHGKGSVADFDYQEDFCDEDNFDEDLIVVQQDSRPPIKRSSSVTLVIFLCVIMMVLVGYVYSLRVPVQNGKRTIQRLDISYDQGGVPFEDPEARKARKEAKEKAEAEAEVELQRKEEKKRKPTVYIEKELDPKLENILDLRLGMFTQCVDHAMMKSSNFRATVRYKVTIETDGSVSSSSIAIKGEKPNKFESCLNKSIKKWRFPKTKERVLIDRKFIVD